MIRIFCILISITLMGVSVIAATITEDFTTPDSGWQYHNGWEFPGANGRFYFDPEFCLGGQPSLRIDADFTNGGCYVGVLRKPLVPHKISELKFKIKTPANAVSVRCTDATGQTYFKSYPLSGKPDAIQEVSITRFGGPAGFANWGPHKAAEFVQPVVDYTFLVHKVDLPNTPKWTTCVGDVRLSGELLAKIRVSLLPEQWLAAPGTELALPVVGGEPTAGQRGYQISGFGSDKPDFTGKAGFSAGKLRVPLPQEEGFYEIFFPELDWRSGVIVMRDYTGERDPFFGTDAIFSNWDKPLWPAVASSARFLKRLGLSAVRDRFVWRELEPEKGEFKWYRYETIRKYCKDAGITVLDVWYEAPGWTGAAVWPFPATSSRYPEDLVAASESLQTIARKFSDLQSMVEIWNEPEFMPGEQLAAVHRMAAWAFQEAGVDTKLCGGVLNGFQRSPEILDPYLDSGLLDVSDAFSFHNYYPPVKMESQIAEFRERIKGRGRDGIPFLITECGKPWPRGTKRATVVADRISAVGIAANAVEAKACGIAQFHAFCFPYFDEVQNNFGMIDKNHTPMRSLGAYVGAIRQLSGFVYAGDLPVRDVDRARVFFAGKRAVVALFIDREGATAILPNGFTVEEARGIDGRKLPLPQGGKIAVADRLIYLHTSRAAVEPFLIRDTEAMRLSKLARAYKPAARLAQPLVYQFRPNLTILPYRPECYLLASPRNSFTFTANNLGNKPLTAKPRFRLPEGASVSQVPEQIELAPRSRQNFTVDIDFGKLPDSDKILKVELFDEDGLGGAVVSAFQTWRIEQRTVPARADSAEQNPPTIPNTDGWQKLTDWSAWESTQTKPDIEGFMRIFRTSNGLDVQVVVHDDKFHSMLPASNAWRGDSVQIVMQPLYKNRIPGGEMVEVTAAMTADGPILYRNRVLKGGEPGMLKKSRFFFTAAPGVQFYRLELDSSELELDALKPGSRLGLSLLVNSNNGEDRRGYLKWGEGANSKNPNEFNQLLME